MKQRQADAENGTSTGNKLEISIGREVRFFRKKMDLTIADLAKLAGLSTGMLSKIENGIASPSLATLQALSSALNIPVTAFFRKFEEERDIWQEVLDGVRQIKRGQYGRNLFLPNALPVTRKRRPSGMVHSL